MEIATANRWLYWSLTSDPSLMSRVNGVFGWPAPSTVSWPIVLYQLYTPARDVLGVGPKRFFSDLSYTIRGVFDLSSIAGLPEQVADRIDVVLNAKSGTVSSGVVIQSVRESPFYLEETIQGRTFVHLGGIYRLFVN